jgi:hypothetical protein
VCKKKQWRDKNYSKRGILSQLIFVIFQAPLDQFIMFGMLHTRGNTADHSNTRPGDSITQAGYDQSKGFALAAELQSGTVPSLMNGSRKKKFLLNIYLTQIL